MSNEQKSLFLIIGSAIEKLVETGELPEISLPPDEGLAIPFADGARDGIAVYHMGVSELTDETRELMERAVDTASDGEFEEAERLFTELGRQAGALSVIDELQSYIIANSGTLSVNSLCDFAVYAMTSSTDRECVKFGLSIIELINIEDNDKLKSVVSMLGHCDEFTLFSLFVMSRWSDGNANIAYLATQTHGWGRIHAIERLKPDTEEIRQWLLREGVHNTVLPAYSALTCWDKSGAEELLETGNKLSDEDFHGIRDIIDALLDEGPCAGISGVSSPVKRMREFLAQAADRDNLDLDDYMVIRNIRGYDETGCLPGMCDDILNTEQCRECVSRAVKEGKAIEFANELGIDCKPDVLELLAADVEKNAHLCVHMLEDEEYREKAIAVFREKLPLEEMKAAPTTELGLGKAFSRENALDFIVQYLGNFPLKGIELIETSLQCAPPRNRNFALRALQDWVNEKQTPLETLLPEMFALVCELKDNEPDDKVREKMEKLIRGEIDETDDA